MTHQHCLTLDRRLYSLRVGIPVPSGLSSRSSLRHGVTVFSLQVKCRIDHRGGMVRARSMGTKSPVIAPLFDPFVRLCVTVIPPG